MKAMGNKMDVDTKVESYRMAGAATGLAIYGLTLNEWVAVATLLYMILQTVIIFPKAITTIKSWFKK